ncbi:MULTISPECIES: hypothetical protein [unclassified Mesorhizobium]|nr:MULTISPECIES: hypothetical protein [unclassified Mesorhizobium]
MKRGDAPSRHRSVDGALTGHYDTVATRDYGALEIWPPGLKL